MYLTLENIMDTLMIYVTSGQLYTKYNDDELLYRDNNDKL